MSEYNDMIRFFVRCLIGLALAAALIVGLVAIAAAHEWYDAVCCNDRDCAPIPDHAVRETPDGWLVTLHPGEHPLVTRGIVQTFSHGTTRQSQDGRFHACTTLAGDLRCFYAPPMAF